MARERCCAKLRNKLARATKGRRSVAGGGRIELSDTDSGFGDVDCVGGGGGC